MTQPETIRYFLIHPPLFFLTLDTNLQPGPVGPPEDLHEAQTKGRPGTVPGNPAVPSLPVGPMALHPCLTVKCAFREAVARAQAWPGLHGLVHPTIPCATSADIAGLSRGSRGEGQQTLQTPCSGRIGDQLRKRKHRVSSCSGRKSAGLQGPGLSRCLQQAHAGAECPPR